MKTPIKLSGKFKKKHRNKKLLDINNEKILLQNCIEYLPCVECNKNIEYDQNYGKEIEYNEDNKYCTKCKKQVCLTCLENRKHKCYKKISSYKTITNDPRTCIDCRDLQKYNIGKFAILYSQYIELCNKNIENLLKDV